MVKRKETELTKEEEKIIEQTIKEEIKEELPQKFGVVVTGGIDSNVLLYHVKKIMKKDQIQPILIIDDPEDKRERQSVIKDHLTTLNIENPIKSFTVNTKADWKEVLQWCHDNNVNPLCFATNNDEYLQVKAHSPERILELQQYANDNGLTVQVHEPFRVIPKSDILLWAKDYGLLEKGKSVQPNYRGADGTKLEKIYKEALAIHKLDDPFEEKETITNE